MIIESLDLKSYRNYSDLSMTFDGGTNIIFGDNAQGKTNILEALYVSATTKSHRSSKDKELITIGKDESHIKTVVNKNNARYRIDIHLKNNKPKGIAINGIPIKKAVDLFGIINIVIFSPEDLSLVKDGPAARRRFMDMELSQIDKIYLSNLVNYNKVVVQRNKLLKDISITGKGLDTLDIWDMQLVKYGSELITRRRIFVEELNEIVDKINKNLTGGREILRLEYEPDVIEDNFEKIIAADRERDLKLKATNHGPHKDDIIFWIDDNNGKVIDARKFGSQGQQRTCALGLKLAEIELVKSKVKDSPILLLDDVLSELDSNRQNYLLDAIGEIQTIITCTGLDEFIKNRFQINQIYKVVQGQVTPVVDPEQLGRE